MESLKKIIEILSPGSPVFKLRLNPGPLKYETEMDTLLIWLWAIGTYIMHITVQQSIIKHWDLD
jgi:hypothetical protein